jgi:hypothetical protein
VLSAEPSDGSFNSTNSTWVSVVLMLWPLCSCAASKFTLPVGSCTPGAGRRGSSRRSNELSVYIHTVGMTMRRRPVTGLVALLQDANAIVLEDHLVLVRISLRRVSPYDATPHAAARGLALAVPAGDDRARRRTADAFSRTGEYLMHRDGRWTRRRERRPLGSRLGRARLQTTRRS